jgi:MATE family multidrug resistance protein
MTITSRARLVVDARAIVALGGPLLGNNLSITGMAFADTVMAGQLGAVDLGGLAIGAATFNLFMFVGFGLLMATSPSVAHAYGANDASRVTAYARQSWWLVLVLSMLLFTGMRQADRFLPAIGISRDVLPVAVGYVHAISWGMPGLLAFFSLRYTSEGLGRTKPIMFTGFLGLTLNIIGNWIFMYGKFGAPELGAVGCGVATAISMWAMFFALLLHVRMHRAYRPFKFFARVDPPDWTVLGELARIGAPIAGSILAEGGLFVSAALMMGGMGAVTAAGHQIALNYAAFMFMVPLAISSATTIHVGHTLGRGDVAGARHAGLIGISMCAAVMTISAIVILLLNDQIAALYTRDAPVRELAASLLLMAALFQFSDGVQVGAAGALRGFKDTTIPMAMCIFSYWVVAFSFAYYFGVYRGEGPVLVWIGLNIGLTISAVLLVTRYLLVTRARLNSSGGTQLPAL